MTDKKLTDNEIVKALENWIKNYEGTYGNFRTLGLALDLINRLQVELTKERNKNSKLRNERNHPQADLDSLIENDLPKCKHALRRANKIGMELQAENERLNKEIDRLSQVVLYNDGVTEMKVKEAKSEAYKEFAEKLCDGRVSNDNIVILAKCLLKELVGEDK